MVERTQQSPSNPAGAPGTKRRSDLRIASSLGLLVVGMLGLSYAAVPLYQLFCQVTGYAGTTQRADSAPATALDRKILVRFDANVSGGLKWRFKPAVATLETQIGAQTLAHYEAKNLTDRRITGTATFNVTPEIAGQYFSKIECFCFTEQTLEPGASVDMPVSFYIDPAMVEDVDTRDLEHITLSYTFFEVDAEPKKNASLDLRGRNSLLMDAEGNTKDQAQRTNSFGSAIRQPEVGRREAGYGESNG